MAILVYVVSMTDGAMRIASSPRGQMATAVVVVLLAWAVLSKRIYVISWSKLNDVGPTINNVEGSFVTRLSYVTPEPPATQPPPREAVDDKVTRISSCRRTRLDDGIKRPLNAVEVHHAAGMPPRDDMNRVTSRPGAYWSEPDSSGFRVRGPTYLMDKVKIGSPAPVFELLDCDLFDLPQPTSHLMRFLQPRIDALWRDRPGVSPKRRYTFVVQLQVPGPPHKSFVIYFGCVDASLIFDSDTPFARIARRFFVAKDSTPGQSSDLHKWRNNTFKLIPRCVNAPFVVKRAVGEVPTLLGNKLQQSYFGRHDYFEVDVNISSSRIAQYTVGLALNYSSVVICDLAFVLQGATAAELPEVIAGCMRIEHINMKDAVAFVLPPG